MRVDQTYRLLASLILLLLISSDGWGQFLDPRAGKEHFNKGNYKAALGVYKKLLQQDKGNVEYNHKVGVCYLKTNINRSLAVMYLRRCITSTKVDPEIYFDLGLAYQYALKFKDAIGAFTQHCLINQQFDHRIQN